MVIADGAAWLRHIGNAASVRPLNIIPEGEECIRPQGYARKLIQPRPLLFPGKYLWLHLESLQAPSASTSMQSSPI